MFERVTAKLKKHPVMTKVIEGGGYEGFKIQKTS